MMINFEEEIRLIVDSLKSANEDLLRIQEQYKDNPELMKFYEHSAKVMIDKIENQLEALLKHETNKDYSVSSANKDVDFWIRLEGDSFNEGHGPIGIIGSYFKKLNSATKHSTEIVKNKVKELSNIDISPYFELVDTAKGSLMLGLNSVVPNDITTNEQLNLFYENKTTLEKLEAVTLIRKTSEKSIEVLFKALAAADQESYLEELKQEYSEDEVIKLLHYAKDLAPSSRSKIRSITFHSNKSNFTDGIVTNPKTRTKLNEQVKHIAKIKKYVEGEAYIRQYNVDADTDYVTLNARPLKIGNTSFDEVELRADKERFTLTETDVYKRFINISGFMYFKPNNRVDYVSLESIDSLMDDLDDQDNETLDLDDTLTRKTDHS